MPDNAPLLPERHPESDLFIADIADAVVKGDMNTMEHPIFVLTKQSYMKTKRYEHNGNWLEVAPSHKGVANIYDKDVLIFAISQLMAAKNRNETYSKHVSFTAYDFFIFSNRNTSGREYEALKDSLERLRGTSLMTNIKRGEDEQWETFGLIDKARIRRKHRDGRVIEWGITLSDWLFNAIESNQVLSLNHDYFRLKKPLERRLYEIARKHCARKTKWNIGIALLQKKCGSSSPKKHFKHMLKAIIEHQHLPDYDVSLNDEMVTFFKTGEITKTPKIEQGEKPQLKASTYERAGELCRTKGLDKYDLEYEWWEWAHDKEKPKNGYDAAFLGFVKMKLENY